MASDKPVIIIGGGWAGISAAIHLTQSGQPVTLIEAAEQLGGRARMVMFDDLPVDNGQHIALGAYRHLLKLLDIIGLDESLVFSRLPLSLNITGNDTTVKLNTPRLPAPLHLLATFLKADGLDTADKFKLIINGLRLMGVATHQDMTVTELLLATGQPGRVIHYLWSPLCIAALNTCPDIASARVFQRVLKDTFMRQRADSDLLLPRHDMGRVFPQPAQTWLTRHGASILTRQRVTGLACNDHGICGVNTSRQTIAASRVILAANPWTAAQLIEDIHILQPLHRQLTAFRYEPIITVFLKYKRAVLLDPPMQGLVDTTTQWVFDRRITNHSKVLAAVISASGNHATMTKDELTQAIVHDIKAHTPLQDDPVDSMVVRERRATFSATPATESIRPGNITGLPGLVLAGDYTQTGYPATLEGAVISGKSAAQTPATH